jgi:hypothetical protein
LETVFSIWWVQSGYEEDNWDEKRWRYISIDSSAAGYSSDSNDMSTEAEESPLLRAITMQRLVKPLQAGEKLAYSDLYSVEISDCIIVICS